MAEKLLHLHENYYFDEKNKVIVKNMGNRFVFVRHDRRTKSFDVKNERRLFEKTNKDLIKVTGGFYFDKKIKQLYKLIGKNLVLYSKDRRKTNKSIKKEKRILK